MPISSINTNADQLTLPHNIEGTKESSDQPVQSSFLNVLMDTFIANQVKPNQAGQSVQQSHELIRYGVLNLFTNVFSNAGVETIEERQNTFYDMLQNNLHATTRQTPLTTQLGLNFSKESISQTSPESAIEPANLMKEVFGEDGFNMRDGLDALNILNHLPIVSGVYQGMSESSVSVASKLAGSALYGGPAGLAFSVADIVFEQVSGTSISDYVADFNYANALQPLMAAGLAFFQGDDAKHSALDSNNSNLVAQSTTAFSIAQQLSK